MKKKILILLLLFNVYINAQCEKEITIEICDITEITNGLVNLYDLYSDKTGNIVSTGKWVEVVARNFSLIEPEEGTVNIWNLTQSSLGNQYTYKLYNDDCNNKVALTLNLRIGAFSGNNNNIGDNIIRLCYTRSQQFCDTPIIFDLRNALEPKPGAHQNGTWEYIGKEGNNGEFLGIKKEHFFKAIVPYVERGSLIESEIFEFKYTVNSDLVCNSKSETTVKIAIVRAISAGYGTVKTICEEELISTTKYDNDINLRDDKYLRKEDVEGYWEHIKNTLTPSQSSINIKNIYTTLKAQTPRFRNKVYKYTYKVSDPSNLCGNDSGDVEFIIIEKLKPFKPIQGKEKLKICANSNNIKKIDLYENLKFTEENGIVYDYDIENNTNYWSVSPQFTGVIMDRFLLKNPDWKFDELTNLLSSSIPKTKIDLSFLTGNDIKKYKFTYTVPKTYNYVAKEHLPKGCLSVIDIEECNIDESASIIVEIQGENYLGKNTSVEICESEFTPTIDLISLLDKDADKKIDTTGTWEDLETKTEIKNIFTFPTFKGESKTFKLKYSTPTNICNTNKTILTLKIYNNNAGGKTKSLIICPSENSFNLFSKLDNASTNGTWTDPDLKIYLSHELIINPKKIKTGFYVYKIPDIIDEQGDILCEGKSCVVKLSTIDSYAGEDTSDLTFCENYFNDNSIDLYDIIKKNTEKTIDKGGIWINFTTKQTINNIFTFTPFTENKKTFNLKYTSPNLNGCSDIALLSFTIYKAPNAGNGINKTICSQEEKFKLFTLLEGTPSSNGFWTLPDKTTKDNDFILEPSNAEEGDYIYIYIYIECNKSRWNCKM